MLYLVGMIAWFLAGIFLDQQKTRSTLKKVAYVKNFLIREQNDDEMTEYTEGFLAGMDYLVEEVTQDELTYWRG